MTRHLDLRTGRPVWMNYRSPRIATSRLQGDLTTDVLIVGAGISGAMIAEQLSSHGFDIVMIDRRGPILGSTPATTALVQFEIDVPLIHLGRKIGVARAQAAWRRSRLALANLKARIQELGIACDLEERSSLYLSGNQLNGGELQDEQQMRQACGLYCDYLDPAALMDRFGIAKRSALLSRDNLTLNPRRLTAGLLNIALKRGMKIFDPVDAKNFETSKGCVMVTTDGGQIITAKHVVLATGYELAPIVPKKGHRIISTWAMATRPQPDKIWPEAALIWEASDPYLYMRSTQDGRVICGGEDETFQDEEKRDALIASKIDTIAKKLKKLMPHLDVVPDFGWAGSFGTTPDGLPIIGKMRNYPGIHAIMGYGGNGITFSRIAAELVTSEIVGQKDCDRALFAPAF